MGIRIVITANDDNGVQKATHVLREIFTEGKGCTLSADHYRCTCASPEGWGYVAEWVVDAPADTTRGKG